MTPTIDRNEIDQLLNDETQKIMLELKLKTEATMIRLKAQLRERRVLG